MNSFEFEPLSTLKLKMSFGVNHVNIMVLDVCLNTHVAVYNFTDNSFVNYHTEKEIRFPVMWCELPRFNEGMFNALVEEF